MVKRSPFQIKNCVTLEVPLDSLANREFKFKQTDSLLDGKNITGFAIVPAAIGMSPGSAVVVPDSVTKKSYMSLQRKDTKIPVKDFPLALCFDSVGMAFIELAGEPIDFTSSVIKVPDTTGATAGQVFVITFFYDAAK